MQDIRLFAIWLLLTICIWRDWFRHMHDQAAAGWHIIVLMVKGRRALNPVHALRSSLLLCMYLAMYGVAFIAIVTFGVDANHLAGNILESFNFPPLERNYEATIIMALLAWSTALVAGKGLQSIVASRAEKARTGTLIRSGKEAQV